MRRRGVVGGRDQGKMLALGTLGRKSSGGAYDMNDRGQVVGEADTKAKDEDGISISHAFLWQSGKMIDLGTLGGPGSVAHALNESGQVVGAADTKAEDAVLRTPISHAFLWEDGKMIDLPTLGGKHSVAIALNERGQIVGRADTTAKDEDG